MKGKSGFLELLAHSTVPARDASKEVLLLFPLMEGSLFGRVTEGKGVYDERKAAVLTCKIAVALKELHDIGFIHGDLKPQNVLLDRQGNPVLCDLASCRAIRTAETRKEALEIQEDAERYCTACCRPPELHDVKTGGTLDGKVDVFGLGCILFFAVSARNPFEGAEGFLKLALMQGLSSFYV